VPFVVEAFDPKQRSDDLLQPHRVWAAKLDIVGHEQLLRSAHDVAAKVEVDQRFAHLDEFVVL